MKTILLLLLLNLPLMAQNANIHVAAGNNQAVSVGVDYRDKFSLDFINFKVCKNPGGCGRQTSIKTTIPIKVRSNIYLQSGIVYDYYKVETFDKKSLQVLGGIRIKDTRDKIISEVNYRHDLTSENRVKTLEIQATFYLPKHLFIRANGRLRNFKDFYNQNKYDAIGQVLLGVHF